jgi:hypothetical protein
MKDAYKVSWVLKFGEIKVQVDGIKSQMESNLIPCEGATATEISPIDTVLRFFFILIPVHVDILHSEDP